MTYSRHLFLTLLACSLGCGDTGSSIADASSTSDTSTASDGISSPDTTAPQSDATPTTDTPSPLADAAASSDAETSAPDPDLPTRDPNCPPVSGWQPGTPAYAVATSAWGLDGVMGIRMSVTDLDGDGWPDLLVRNGGGPDDFSEGGSRSRWVLRNTGTGTFEDVTESSGLLTRRFPGDPPGRPGDTFTSGDVDNDGDLDVFVGHTRTDVSDLESETSELMLNNGDGTFSLGPADSYTRFQYVASKPAGIAFLDYDLDGLLDLWIVHNEQSGPAGLPDYLLRGEGAGSFANVIWEMGVTSKPWNDLGDLNEARGYTWGWSGAACDLNNDGLSELLAASYGRFPNHLWRAVPGPDGGTGSYDNVSIASGYAFDDRVDWTDNVSAQCHCADFPADADCSTVPPPPSAEVCQSFVAAFGTYRWNHATGREPFSLGGNSASTVCADIDNDGWVDLMTGEIVHWDVGSSSDPAEVLLNTQDPAIRFERPGNDVTGLVRVNEYEGWDHGDMTTAVFDFDNDGWQDIYIGSSDYPGNKALLFRQTAPAQFEHVAIEDYFLHYRAHGVAIADFDRDGDLDVVAGHSLMRCDGFPGDDCGPTPQIQLYENLTAATTRWLQVHLTGTGGSNRAAIGARVEVSAGGVTQTQYVDGGHGHFGLQRDLTLHFGLGQACEAQVTVHWPDREGSVQTFTVAANQRVAVIQGEAPSVD